MNILLYQGDAEWEAELEGELEYEMVEGGEADTAEDNPEWEQQIQVSVYSSFRLYIYFSIFLSIYSSTYLSIYLSIMVLFRVTSFKNLNIKLCLQQYFLLVGNARCRGDSS